jgi:hypothetical protein
MQQSPSPSLPEDDDDMSLPSEAEFQEAELAEAERQAQIARYKNMMRSIPVGSAKRANVERYL